MNGHDIGPDPARHLRRLTLTKRILRQIKGARPDDAITALAANLATVAAEAGSDEVAAMQLVSLAQDEAQRILRDILVRRVQGAQG